MEPSRVHGIIAKITDFGMSTMLDPGDSHVSNFNKGTPGYSAPEVMHAHQATKKSDVSVVNQDLTRSNHAQIMSL